MNVTAIRVLSAFLGVASLSAHATDRAQSAFLKTTSDVLVNSTSPVTILTRTITLTAPAAVFASVDGRYYAVDAPAGEIRIAIDGSVANTSDAITDWGSSSASAQHSFNAIASANLAAGTHTVSLIANSHPSRPGRFRVGAASSLAVFVQPLSKLNVQSLAGESGNINLTTYNPSAGIDITEGNPSRPKVTILTNSVTNTLGQASKIVSLVSGRAFNSCDSGIDSGRGDALWGLWENGSCQTTATAAWSVNDIDDGAELQAPMYTHGATSLAIGQTKSIAFGASELAFGSDSGAPHENGVCYKVGTAKLISASQGVVIGSSTVSPATPCATYKWKCVATTQGSVGCPAAGTHVTLGQATVNIPAGHDGIVFFSAKATIQMDPNDSSATVGLGINVDGVDRGSEGVQQLIAGYTASRRTLSAGYLSAPNGVGVVLTPGNHTVKAYMYVTGASLKYPSATEDVALTYFD